MKNRTRRSLYMVLIVALCAGAWACATSPISKAVQAASIQKQLVESSAVEFAKLHIQGKVPDAAYAQGKAAYEKWAKAEAAVAKSLADWKRLEDTDSSKRLSEALRLSGGLFRAYVDAVGQWVDLNALRQKLGG